MLTLFLLLLLGIGLCIGNLRLASEHGLDDDAIGRAYGASISRVALAVGPESGLLLGPDAGADAGRVVPLVSGLVLLLLLLVLWEVVHVYGGRRGCLWLLARGLAGLEQGQGKGQGEGEVGAEGKGVPREEAACAALGGR